MNHFIHFLLLLKLVPSYNFIYNTFSCVLCYAPPQKVTLFRAVVNIVLLISFLRYLFFITPCKGLVALVPGRIVSCKFSVIVAFFKNTALRNLNLMVFWTSIFSPFRNTLSFATINFEILSFSSFFQS